jgi:hypothetical protein
LLEPATSTNVTSPGKYRCLLLPFRFKWILLLIIIRMLAAFKSWMAQWVQRTALQG